MSPNVVKKKLVSMTTYLDDLLKYKKIDFDQFTEKHYEIERILELLIMTASDIVFHLIVEKGGPSPTTYRAAFLRAGELKILSRKLSENLALSAGLRNILVHVYEEIDYKIVHESIPAAIRDFKAFIKQLS